jgi:hypothetical protein
MAVIIIRKVILLITNDAGALLVALFVVLGTYPKILGSMIELTLKVVVVLNAPIPFQTLPSK